MCDEPVVTVEKWIYQGLGLAHWNRKTIFVPRGLPGDEVRIRLRKKKNDWEGHIVDLISPSPLRGQALCQVAAHCGGCLFNHVAYLDQVALKQTMLNDVFRKFFPPLLPVMAPILPAEFSRFYRNKMDYAFGKMEGRTILGQKKAGTFDQVVETRDCQLLSEDSQAMLGAIAQFFDASGLSVWDYREKKGILRHCVIRHSKAFDQYMVHIVSGQDISAIMRQFSQMLGAQFPKVSSIYLSVNPKDGDQLYPEYAKHISGAPMLKEKIGEYTFDLLPLSFFQTNTHQAKVLYDIVADAVQKVSPKRLLDLYCGVGSIGIYVSEATEHLLGIEENPHAIENAKRNAAQNGVRHGEFLLGGVRQLLKGWQTPVDMVIVDPPRAGMDPKALERMANLGAKHLIYVSCNPVTLGRDLQLLQKNGYAATLAQPVDMFPHTYHIETVVLLKKV